MFQKFRENWVRPALFFGNNPISLAGGAITSASGVTMIGYWLVELFGRRERQPLPRHHLLSHPARALHRWAAFSFPSACISAARNCGKPARFPREFPKIDLNDRMFRHGIDIVLVATIVNLLVVAVASYRGAAYMDSPQFCGQSCHVMHPEYTAYKISAHSHVACVDCHIGSGAASYFQRQGQRHQAAHRSRSFHRRIPDCPFRRRPFQNLRPAREICEGCHTPARFIGEKLLVKSSFADDENNTETQTVVVLHLGGQDSLSHLTGIHGVHLGHIEYISTDPTRTTIPWVQRPMPTAPKPYIAASPSRAPAPRRTPRDGLHRLPQPRRAHHSVPPKKRINRAMAEGAVSPELPGSTRRAWSCSMATTPAEDEART